MRDTAQKEILQWLCRLEEIAARNHVKTRLLDAVQDCKRDFESKRSRQDWQVKCRELEELLGQIKKQMPYDLEAESLADDIRQKASEMIERCKRSNEIQQKEYINGSSTYINEAERSIKELSNVRANYDDVTDRGRFLTAIGNIGQKYKQQMDELEEKYINALNQNYQNVFDRVKTLFSSTGYDREAERRFYETYYENQDSLIRNAQGYAYNLEKGESSISEFAEKIQEPIQQKIGRIRRKALWKKWMPIIMILIVIALGVTGNIVRQRIDASNQPEETAEQTEDPEEFQERLRDRFMDQIVDSMADDASEKLGGIILEIVIPILILVVLLYIFWMRSIDKQCRNNIIRESERLLTTAFEDWRQQGTLMASVKESFRLTEIYVDKQYSDLLSELLNGGEGVNAEKAEFIQLCSDWENIKRKVEF